MRALIRASTGIALLFLITTHASAADADFDGSIAAFTEFAQQRMKSANITGLSVAVMKDDLVWSGGFGLADIENQVPATALSSYRMASVTKPMTALAIMQLVGDGKIDLDAEIQTYVPYFPKKEHPVTVRQLLGHLGGISHYRDYSREGRFREPMTTREAIGVFADFGLIAVPGSAYNYTSYGYNLLGAAIEGASGKPYGEFLRERLWKPLGMDATRMDDPRALIPHRVRGYVLEDGNVRNSEYVDISSRFAAGGTRSTVVDLIAMVRGIEAGKALPPALINQMWTESVTTDGFAVRYGLGFDLSPRGGRFIVQHNGSQPETVTELLYVPSRRFAVALASNQEDTDLAPFARRLMELILGDTWQALVYTSAPGEQLPAIATTSVYTNGLAHFDRRGTAKGTAGEAARSFDYFNAITAGKNREAVEERVNRGRHPAGGEAFITLGSWIAQRLREQGTDLDRYHSGGPFLFFSDYVELYRRDRSIPRSHRFTPDFEKTLARWNRDWARVWTAEVRGLDFTDPASAPKVATLQQQMRGASIMPDFSRPLVSLAERQIAQGKLQEAFGTTATALEVYPDAESPNALMGMLLLIQGERERGASLMRKAGEISKQGYINPSNIRRAASFVAGMDKKDAALEILEVGAEIHPDDAPLLTQLASYYQSAGRAQEARSTWQLVLKLDPSSSEARAALGQ